eukprot:NODE_165_length_16345_cov_0.329743.p6 type:complete len:189 gc:universal NODE_165_length_16345_cov_0.329743:8949-8383(-)
MRPLVLLGPSGVGKSTFIKKLFAEYPDKFGFSISHTTRKPRRGEVEDVNYHYISKEEFMKLISENQFVEHAIYAGNHYGTSFKAVQDIADLNKICVLDIDSQGVDQLSQTSLNPVLVLIKAPSIQELEARLRKRATDDDSVIKSRLEIAVRELEWAKTKHFDGVVVNDELEYAYEQLKSLLKTLYNDL